MHNNNKQQHFLHATSTGIALATMLLAYSAVYSQASPPAAAELAPQALALARVRYDQAIDSALYDEAADAAELYIGELLSDPNHERLEWGFALQLLGHAQHLSGDNDAAIENYMLSIEVIESETNRLDPLLIDPLLGLSRTLENSGNHQLAIESYERFLHVQKVNLGLHTLELGEGLNELSEVYFRLGNSQRANALQQSYVSIYNSNFPGDDLQKLPALYSRADMLYKTGHLIDAQLSYRRIIWMIERADGKQSLYLLPAIFRLSELLQNNIIKDGINGPIVARRYLRRAAYIAEKRDDATNLDRADAYIAMGDYLSVRTGDRRAAMRSYHSAWQQLNADDSLIDVRHARFGRPTLINDLPQYATPAMRSLMLLSHLETDEAFGRLIVRYDVDSNGRTLNIELIEGDPTGVWDPIVVDHVDGFIFRPAFKDGEPAEFSNRLYEIKYSLED